MNLKVTSGCFKRHYLAETVSLIGFIRNVFVSQLRGVKFDVSSLWHWKSFAR